MHMNKIFLKATIAATTLLFFLFSHGMSQAWQCTQTLDIDKKGHSSNINSTCFNPTKTILASGDDNGIIKIWDTADKDSTKWTCIQTIQEHTARIN